METPHERSRANTREPVAITGLGAVTALGVGASALWEGLAAGVDGIRDVERFSTEGFQVHTAGMVRLPIDETIGRKGTAELALQFAIPAAKEALLSAGLGDLVPCATRVTLVFGTSLATHPEGIHRLAEITGDAICAQGPRITISTACSSSANAIGYGRDLLLNGAADVVIAGGADALTEEIFAGFHNLGLLAPDKCAPFSEPPGTSLGEGAGFLVLERGEDAAKRGASPVGWVSGYGLSCDAYHATSPDPSGAGVARAARAALADAGLSASDINYVNAHGTGTETNDPAEWRAISTLLGERSLRVPVSATKSVFGHGQGAAGVLEIIATLLAMQHGRIPQTLHHTRPRPRCPEDPVAQSTPRAHVVEHALCNSSAFGGANAIVVIDARDRRAPSRAVTPRRVFVAGAGLVLPGVSDIFALSKLAPDARLCGTIGARPLSGVDLRGFDPLSRYLTLATADALRDAGLILRGAARDRAGMFTALFRISPASAHELDDSVQERGLLRLSAPAFTRVVLNASTGACCRALQLRGPTTTITTGEGGGLSALVMAAEHLAFRDDADVLCVAAADELDRDEAPENVCEAGVCLVLSASPSASGVELAGWGIAGPGQTDLAIERALSQAGASASARSIDLGGPEVPARTAAPLLHAARSIVRLRGGERSMSLLACDGKSASSAVLFTAGQRPDIETS